LPDTELRLWQHFFEKREADNYYNILLKESPWQQRMHKMYDKMVADPRLTAYYGGDNGIRILKNRFAKTLSVQNLFNYSGISPVKWTHPSFLICCLSCQILKKTYMGDDIWRMLIYVN
jgi:hypothetical protein